MTVLIKLILHDTKLLYEIVLKMAVNGF